MFLGEHLKKKGIDGEVANAILLIAGESKRIKSAFFSNGDQAQTKNVYGERQMELDKLADEMIIEALRKAGIVSEIASEEQPDVIKVAKKGVSVNLDPLDGSSCIKTNFPVGTIFGIFKEGGCLQEGRKLGAAGYVLYGPLTVLVYAAKGKGVHEFILHGGKYALRRENIRMPPGTIYGIGGLKRDWTAQHTRYIETLEGKGYKLRYGGAFVADFHQVLTYGGVFTYPALREKPNGKLRLLFEGAPMAFVSEEAGGSSTNGTVSLLDIKPGKVDQRVPLYVGSKDSIELAEKTLKGK